MKSKKNNKLCFILNLITSFLFAFSGIMIVISEGLLKWSGITNLALSVTFGSIAFIYYKQYKAEK